MDIDKTLKYLSLGYIVVVLNGLVYNIVYYSSFNIRITDYIELSESLTMFIPQLLKIIPFALPLAFLYLFIYRKLSAGHRSLGQIVFTYAFGAGTVVALILLLRMFFVFDSLEHTSLILPPYITYVSLDIMSYLQAKKIIPANISKPLLSLLVALFCYDVIFCYSDIRRVFRNQDLPKVTIILSDNTQSRLDSTSVYLGQTQRYFFSTNP